MTAAPATAVIFDLDGTLLDTLQDIADAANAALRQAGFAAHPLPAYRGFVGDGVEMLFRRALAANADADAASSAADAAVRECVAGFHQHYAECWKRTSVPYPGIPELLDELIARGVPCAVLSNKPDAFTKQCVAEFFGRWKLGPVYGQRPEVPRKPDPAAARAIAAAVNVSPKRMLFVGDSNVDMQTARAAEMTAVGVSWGFRSTQELVQAGAHHVLGDPADLLRYLPEASG